MAKRQKDDTTNRELFELVAAAFATMQQNMDAKFSQVFRKLAEHDKRFERIETKQGEHDERFEEASAERAALSRKLDETVKVTDTHDRMLSKLNR